MKEEPNKITATLKVVVTGEFYDDDTTEETLRYAVEQDLEDAGFDVDVDLLKEQKAVVRCKDCKYCGSEIKDGIKFAKCELKHNWMPQVTWFCADGERKDS